MSMYKVISVVSEPLIAELSLSLYRLGENFQGQVLAKDARRTGNVEVFPWTYCFDLVMQDASVAFFPECNSDIVPFVKRVMLVGVPVVMFSRCQELPIRHNETGMVYLNSTWGKAWIYELATNQELRSRIIDAAKKSVGVR